MKSIENNLGSTYPVASSQIVLFIPNLDKNGKPINQRYWVDTTLTTIGVLFRGATAFPPGRGVWRNDEVGGELLFEDTVMIISYVDPELLTEKSITILRKFLHKFGCESNQGEVGVVINSSYYGITKFDKSEGDSDE